MFTLVNAVLFRGLPFDDPESIVAVWAENAQNQQTGFTHPNYLDLRDQARTLESLAAILNASVNLADDGQPPERLQGGYVSSNFFRMLGEQPVLGRDFVDDDDREGANPAVLLGHNVWQNRYDGDPGVLGLTIRVNSLVTTVIGVMSPNMRFPNNTDVWIPAHMLPPDVRIESRFRGNGSFQVVGRLASGSSIELAREEFQAIGRRLADEYPEANRELGFNLMSFAEREAQGEIRLIFLMLMGAVFFVLLVACANVANLLLARSADREREIAVRVSMGATRWRIVRQLLIESILLAILAGAAGLSLSVFGVRWFDAAVTENVGKPYWMEFTMDPIVFVFMAGVCLATAVLFGLAPALQVSKTDVNEVLKEGSRGSSGGRRARRWADALIVGEIVLTLVLLSGAGFMMGSFLKLASTDLGVETSRLLTMSIYLPLTQYPEPDPRRELFENLEEQMGTVGAIQASALVTALPFGGGGNPAVEVDGMGDGRGDDTGEARPRTTVIWVSDGYLDALGVQMVRGRWLGPDDGLPGSEVAVVNERFVEMHLNGGDPLGRRIRFGNQAADAPDDNWVTIVGVMPNIRQRAVEEIETDPVVYMPLRSNPVRQVALMVRTSADLGNATPLVQEAMRAVQPDLAFFNIMTMNQYLAQRRWVFRVFGLMFSVFAGIALILSAVGLYSVTAHSVTQRTQEIGIRVAHGAHPRQVTWLVLRRALVQLGIGLPIGLAGAAAVGQLLQSVVVQTSATDPLILGTIVLVLAVVAVVACIIPAQRASRLDPMVALRVE